MSEQLLTDIFESYKYGQFNILREKLETKYNTQTQQILIKDFYQHGEFLKEGTCSELCTTASWEISQNCKEILVAKIEGTEPFFKMKHNFLMLNKKEDIEEIRNKKDLESALLTGILFDPSLKQTHKIIETDYDFDTFYIDTTLSFSNDLLLSKNQCRPVLLWGNNLVHLCFDPNEPSMFKIGIQKPYDEIISYFKIPTKTQYLDISSNLKLLLETILNMDIIETNETLTEKPFITIL